MPANSDRYPSRMAGIARQFPGAAKQNLDRARPISPCLDRSVRMIGNDLGAFASEYLFERTTCPLSSS